jgi:hypothetical protein
VLAGAAVVLGLAGVTAVSVHAATRDAPPVAEQQLVPDPTVEPEYTPDYAAPAEPPPTETTAQQSVDTEQAALDALGEIRDQDLSSVSFNGQYAAQLASKTPGISDPFQTTEAGSHEFRATDILAEHRALRTGTTDGTPIVLLKSTDYGKRQEYQGAALWVTFAVGTFADRAEVLDWCATRFPDLSGEELTNQCAARKLEPGR